MRTPTAAICGLVLASFLMGCPSEDPPHDPIRVSAHYYLPPLPTDDDDHTVTTDVSEADCLPEETPPEPVEPEATPEAPPDDPPGTIPTEWYDRPLGLGPMERRYEFDNP